MGNDWNPLLHVFAFFSQCFVQGSEACGAETRQTSMVAEGQVSHVVETCRDMFLLQYELWTCQLLTSSGILGAQVAQSVPGICSKSSLAQEPNFRSDCQCKIVCSPYISESALACEHTAVMREMLVASFVWGILVCAAQDCEEAPMLHMFERSWAPQNSTAPSLQIEAEDTPVMVAEGGGQGPHIHTFHAEHYVLKNQGSFLFWHLPGLNAVAS